MIGFDGVGHRYGERVVLAEITAELTEQRVGIIGANGSGKSTLARLINGLVEPTSGTVTVDGLDTVRDGAAVRRRVGFIFPDPDAQIVMPTVVEDVEFSLRGRRRDADRRAEALAALDRFGLADHADHPAYLLSSGQKQLLAMASILATRPAILVCDEPTTLLDLRHSRRIVELLAGLDQQVVLVTHHLDLLTGWDRVLVIDQGRLVADGEPAPTIAWYRRLMGEPC